MKLPYSKEFRVFKISMDRTSPVPAIELKETSEKFNKSFFCKQESFNIVLDSRCSIFLRPF
jgi:hypothetical protein